jgi:hypothetical protein
LDNDYSSLTVVALKEICRARNLPVSGRKSEIIERLLASVIDDSNPVTESSEPVEDEEASISLDEDEPIEVEEVVDESSETFIVAEKTDDEEILEATLEFEETEIENTIEILEAEIHEAEVIDDLPAVVSLKKQRPTTLIEQLQNPKFAVVVITLLLAGSGWYWYSINQLEPFTPDNLRYGDEMSYTITNGNIDVTDEFISMFTDHFESEEEICRLRVSFSGSGSTAITKGTESDLVGEAGDSLLGAIRARGGLGLPWLTAEKVHTHDYQELDIQRHSPSIIPGSNQCSDLSVGGSGRMNLVTTSWEEIGERETIATQADWSLDIDTTHREGVAMSYGVGGTFGLLESVIPGVVMILSPIEVGALIGDSLIETGATGSYLGWNWNVIGPDNIGGVDMWKVVVDHENVRDLCLGSAVITIWIEESSPWALQQQVDLSITGKEGNRAGCSTTSTILSDLFFPEGTLDYQITFARSSLQRGEKLLDLGRSYASRPNPIAWTPSSSELEDWGDDEMHLPDDSKIRTHPLESALECVPYLSEAVAARAALSGDGYIWRAIDQRTASTTTWNLSWVETDDTSGWLRMNITGPPSDENCTYEAHGAHDNSIAWNRNDIPAALNMSEMEQRLSDESRYQHFTGTDGFFISDGNPHESTRFGHLVVIPGSDYTDWINRLSEIENGATTVDLSRKWDSGGWSNTLSMAADATDGRVIGWNLFRTPS